MSNVRSTSRLYSSMISLIESILALLFIIRSKLCSGDAGDRSPVEVEVLVDGLFEDAFLVAVGAEALQDIFFVCHCADAVALHSFGAEEGHVRRAGLHQWQHRDVVDLLKSGFDGLIGVGRDTRW